MLPPHLNHLPQVVNAVLVITLAYLFMPASVHGGLPVMQNVLQVRGVAAGAGHADGEAWEPGAQRTDNLLEPYHAKRTRSCAYA